MKAAKSVLICHRDEPLNRFGLARWLGSFTDLAAIIVITEPPSRLWRRVRKEIQRSGWLRFADVLAFRAYYRLRFEKTDRAALDRLLEAVVSRYGEIPPTTQVVETVSPNSQSVFELLEQIQPDIILARCKSILRERVFRQASSGTFVMHPGICPEYRNAHGCFWALANRDLEHVGMTLLRVDSGVDTGPVYGYYSYPLDETRESHAVIQCRVVFENLDLLRGKLEEILDGKARPIDVQGRTSRTWGQPWLTAWLRWKRAARRASERACG